MKPPNPFEKFLTVQPMPPDPATVARDEMSARATRLANLRTSEIPLEPGMAARIARRDLEDTPPMLEAKKLVAVMRTGFVPRTFLMLTGSPGRGKTVAAAHVLAECGGVYVKIEDAIRLHRSRTIADQHEWRRIRRATVVVVGELGLEKDYVDGKLTFHELVDVRQEAITIADSNKSLAELRDRYDERTFDRIDPHLVNVWTEGASFRKRRPWRAVLKFRELERVDAQAIEERYASARQYVVTKRLPSDVLVELADARHAAIAELRAAAA
jgi:hypothetical protein